MYKKIVIFGASGGAIKVAKTLKNLNIEFLFFVDNDKKKWGTTVEGKEVCAPAVLTEDEYNILIASDYQAEIEEQLKEMGLIDKIILKEELIMEYVDGHISEFEYLKNIDIKEDKDKRIVFGLEQGLLLGGIESWTFMLVKELKKKYRDINIYTIKTEYSEPEGLEQNIKYFDLAYEHYWKGIKSLVNELAANMPCTIIDSWQNQLLIAVSILKRYYPDKIKCVSVLHSDQIFLYRKTAYMNEYIDAIAGVSRRINEHLHNDFGIDEDKLFYKESPVACMESIQRGYTLDENKPIQLGYAARVTKSAKRVDLLVPLMLELKKQNVNFHLNIAGTGNYFEKLKSSIKENNLEDKVTLLGSIERSSIPDFWKKQDVFISVSDFEGVGLSMLEAMAEGVVPIETNVAGAEEFIENGVNGYYVDIGDIKKISEHVKYLSIHRDKLADFGKISHDIVRDKCNIEDYKKYIADFCI